MSALDELFTWLDKTRKGNKTVQEAAAELALLRAKVAAYEAALNVFVKEVPFASPDPDTGEGMKQWQEGHAG